MAMEPEACIAPPEGNGEPLEEVSVGNVRNARNARKARIARFARLSV